MRYVAFCNARTLFHGALATFLSCTVAAAECVPHWDTSIGNPGMNDTIRSLALLPNGDLVAGGSFTMAGGNPANRIARWDGQTWHQVGDGFDDGTVVDLKVLPNGDLIAGGTFTSAGDVPVNRIARWDGFDWHPFGLGSEVGLVWAMLNLPNGDLIVSDSINVGGELVNRILRWDGSSWEIIGDPVLLDVRALAYFDDGTGAALYAGGTAHSLMDSGLMRWDGDTWSAIDGGLLVRQIEAMTVVDEGDGPRLFVEAEFRVGPLDSNPVTFSSIWNGEGWEMLDGRQVRGTPTIFDDGSGPALFSTAQWPSNLVKWDGSWWIPVADVSDFVNDLAVHDDGSGPALYAAGSFNSIDGKPANRIIRLQHCPPVAPVKLHVPQEFPTIQAAIDAASSGDVVRVAPGTYDEVINFLGKTIIVESERGPKVTTINAKGLDAPAVSVEHGGSRGTTLRGFTITGSAHRGVHIINAVLMIDQCIIKENTAEDAAAGIWVFQSDVFVANSSIVNNDAPLAGGVGVHQYGWPLLRFRDSSITDNTAAEQGGGFVIKSGGASLVRTTIGANHAPSDNSGGGVVAWAPEAWILRSAVYFYDCDFLDNSAGIGGSIQQGNNSSLVVHNCRIHNSHAADRGGALSISGGSQTTTVVSNSVISGNTAAAGGGVYVWQGSDLTLGGTRFCDNEPDHIVGEFQDLGGNEFFIVCDPVLGDLNGDGVVNVADMLILLAAWGPCDASHCPADLNDDGVVNAADLLVLLSNWH